MEILITRTDVSQQSTRFSLSLDGNEIGHAWLNVTLEDQPSGEEFKYVGIVGDVHVTEKLRCGGLGTELLREVIETARTKKCSKLIALSRFENVRAHAFYERLGFIKHGLEFRMNM